MGRHNGNFFSLELVRSNVNEIGLRIVYCIRLFTLGNASQRTQFRKLFI
jgi:hypothetical protein